ncbi:hypothetical protein XCR1_4380005 [Xenorhabdus cabanillasii JM26]|uniref:Uncharacterized protein n=2 Tax=Xenorhabdus cabanillasii TaxID=351673 RepID=A0A3D9UCE6_9GAMM|nr:hypothetical protein Xcab_03319 [Xenorhabdus cabanillasii JM26]REF26887.1 hypothetical protein BDD26_1583 [Xenorhabdus cabanillasii]CDL86706.1 hypothetical protein XCR1_4380005 [Xenorhabdus cabanillasii JM26]
MVCDYPAFTSFQARIGLFCWTLDELFGLIMVEETVTDLCAFSYNADNLNMISTVVK